MSGTTLTLMFERAIRCVLAIQRGEPVSVPWMKKEFGISKATAQRAMLELERLLPVRRELREQADGYSRAVLVLMEKPARLGPFIYRCDEDCRSARCPAALERIAAGWRNGRDIAPGVRGPTVQGYVPATSAAPDDATSKEQRGNR